MNKSQASAIAEKEVSEYRRLSYGEIEARLGTHENFERVSDVGEAYRVEIEFIYDDEDKKTIRVWAAISYSFWSDFSPVVSTFIMAQNGEFIGEYQNYERSSYCIGRSHGCWKGSERDA